MSEKIGIRILPQDMPLSLCTSSGTVGPSLSFGLADAVCVRSRSASLADAAATAIGNMVKTAADIAAAIEAARCIAMLDGIVIVKDDQLKPDRGKTLLEECYADDKADIAVGTTGSPIALAMLPVSRSATAA